MITIDETHRDVVAYRLGLRDLSDAGATLAKKKEALNDATQRHMAQNSTPRSKLDREVDQVLSAPGHSADWISAEKLEELSREVEVWERVVQRRRDTVGKLRTRYSLAVCQQKDVQDNYVAIQRDIAHACADLAKANAKEVECFAEIDAVDADPYFLDASKRSGLSQRSKQRCSVSSQRGRDLLS